MGQNLNIKIHKNQNLKNSQNSNIHKFKIHKIHKFSNLDVNFIPNIEYVNPNLSIFVELIDMDSLDQLQAECNSDCEILALITKIKSAQQELPKAILEWKLEELKCRQAESHYAGKCRKLYLCELNSKLTILETCTKNENMICNTKMQKRSQTELKKLQSEKSLVFNNIIVHHI